ncbi:hypothetical protein [Scytonema sp. PRP1]|uniref:hypothetical protein n=1 Tax=Scytonema sp. PRP1 TaxID=3120513 RepID=UPI00300D0CC6
MISSPVTRLSAIHFKDDIKQLTKYFTGRDWIFHKIDEWLKNESDRFFLLTGEPGVGKSAIAAKLIGDPESKNRENDIIKAYHFCRAGDVETVRPGRIFRSLAAQLVKNLPCYGLALANTIKPVHLEVKAEINIEHLTGSQLTAVYIENLKESDPDNELDILIRAPLAELEKMYAQQQQKPPDAAVILIDSLDEAVTTTGNENLVRLLAKLSNSDLPTWVRFIMTSRPENRVMREFEPLKPYKLEKMSEDNLKDIRKYIEKRVENTNFQAVLQKAKVKDEILSNEIVELSMGIFLYTKLLLDDIEVGNQPLDDLSALPKSIDEIYHNFLNRLGDKWQNKYQPILGRLTVTQEPLTEEQLVNFTGINPEQLREDLGVVRQFLYKNEEGKQTYAIFHQSLRDYLLDKERNNNFWCDAQTQHNKIVDYYKKDSQSWEEVDWTKADKYGLLHLPKHLDAAGREEDLYTLLTGSPNWMESKFKFFSRDTEYVNDLESAINKFTDPLESNQLLTLVKLYTARQVVHQRSSNYEDIDLKTLVLLGRETEALAYARLRKNVNSRFTALMAIYNALQEKSQFSSTVLDAKDVFNEAREVAKLLDKVSLEAKTLLDFVDFATALLKASNFSEAEKLADEIKNTSVKVKILQKLAVALAQAGNSPRAIAVFKKVKELIDTIEEDWAKAQALSELAVALSIIGEAQEASKFFSKAKEVTNAITDNLLKTDKLINLALALAQAQEVNEASLIFNEAKELARTIETWEQIKVLPKLATAYSQVGFANQAKEVFIEVKNLVHTEQNWALADDLANLATALVQAQDVTEATKIFRQAIEVKNGFEKGWELTERLRKFAQALVQAEFTNEATEFFTDARKSASTIQQSGQRSKELLDLAGALVRARLIEEGRAVFAEAEELAHTTEKESRREKALSKWAAVLNQASFTQEALTICNDHQKVNQAAQEIEQYWEEASSYSRNAIEELLMKNSEQEAGLQELIREEFMSIKAINLIQNECFTEALSTLGLKERPNQFLENLAVWTRAFKEFDQKLLVNILQETTRIFGWTYPYWNDIYAKFTYSRHDFLPPKKVERLEACIQEAITILSSNIPKSEQFEKIVKKYILDIISAKLNIV